MSSPPGDGMLFLLDQVRQIMVRMWPPGYFAILCTIMLCGMFIISWQVTPIDVPDVCWKLLVLLSFHFVSAVLAVADAVRHWRFYNDFPIRRPAAAEERLLFKQQTILYIQRSISSNRGQYLQRSTTCITAIINELDIEPYTVVFGHNSSLVPTMHHRLHLSQWSKTQVAWMART
jgi:hypothetical protein